MKSVGYFLQNPYHLQKKKKKIVGILQFIRIQITIYLKQYKNKFVFTKKKLTKHAIEDIIVFFMGYICY